MLEVSVADSVLDGDVNDVPLASTVCLAPRLIPQYEEVAPLSSALSNRPISETVLSERSAMKPMTEYAVL